MVLHSLVQQFSNFFSEGALFKDPIQPQYSAMNTTRNMNKKLTLIIIGYQFL